jgi:UDP-N-acetylmuramate dehydrogenase
METIEKRIRKNVLLKDYSTFRIGGKAKYFFIAKTKSDLISAIGFARENKLPFFLLGGGSNILFPDRGTKAVVIKVQNSEFKIKNLNILSDAGTPLNQLVKAAMMAGLSGLEWAIGIPGTLGGAIFGNAGWGGDKKNISSVIESVEVLEVKPRFGIKEYKLKNCKFGYRDSIFKRKCELVILSAKLNLKRGSKEGIKKEMSDILKRRKEKIPFGFSAGSVFKNPKNNFAANLIEKCNLKGKTVGGAKISEKHANFIINFNKANEKDVKKLITLAKRKVKNKFNINLEEEIVTF